MKTVIKVLAVFGAIGVMVFGVIFVYTAPIAKVGDAFIHAWGSGNIQMAHPHLSRGFKRKNSLEQLRTGMARVRLNQPLEADWHNRSINNNVGTLAGTLTRGDGSVMTARMSFLKEAGQWKIDAMHFNAPPDSVHAANTVANNGPTPWNRQSGGRSSGAPAQVANTGVTFTGR